MGASLLRSYGLGQKNIDTLKRWDRVHVIRDLSTKAASDGMGDGLERYARGEKMKLSDQKQMYRERIQEIWRRQLAALSSDVDVNVTTTNSSVSKHAPSSNKDSPVSSSKEKEKKQTKNLPVALKDPISSDSDSDEADDLAAALEEDMLNVRQT